MQVADELTRADFSINADSTLHSDGTSKKGHSYETYDMIVLLLLLELDLLVVLMPRHNWILLKKL